MGIFDTNTINTVILLQCILTDIELDIVISRFVARDGDLLKVRLGWFHGECRGGVHPAILAFAAVVVSATLVIADCCCCCFCCCWLRSCCCCWLLLLLLLLLRLLLLLFCPLRCWHYSNNIQQRMREVVELHSVQYTCSSRYKDKQWRSTITVSDLFLSDDNWMHSAHCENAPRSF